VDYFKIFSDNLLGRTEENRNKHVRIAGLRVAIPTQDIPKTKHGF